MDGARHVRVAVIGAGFGGIGTGIRLLEQGHRDFLIFDRGDDVGGTWRDNTYPGCACDVPSHLYSLSFAPNPLWTRSFSGQREIWDYLRRTAADRGLTGHLRPRHEVHAAHWDEAAQRWVLDTSQGHYSADVLVAAGGPLTEPSVPKLPGLETFAGEVFHSARWNHGYDLAGKRVAVVGTGASAAQFVPEIAPRVGHLYVFQRTAPWVLPRGDRAFTATEKRLFARVPAARRVARAGVYIGRELGATAFLRPAVMRVGERIARRHLRGQVADAGLRAALTPTYRMGCKRVLLSNDYYPTLTRENVALVTDDIAEVRPDAVVTADGTVREVDAIIFGTGFHVTDLPLAEAIRGRGGRSLAEVWQGSMNAYKGSSVAGFPNLFLLLGPNTGLGHNSVVFMIEAQIRYLLGMLRHLDRVGGPIEPTPEAQRAYTRAVDRRMAGTVWLTGGCHSWYLDATGRNSTLWPGYTFSYWARTRRFDPSAFRRVVPGTDRAEVAA